MHAALLRRAFWLENRPEVTLGQNLKLRRHNSDYGEKCSIQGERGANKARVTAKVRGPQAFAQQHYMSALPDVLLRKRAPGDWSDSQQIEERSADRLSRNSLGTA